MQTLFVILGAGASRDCTSPETTKNADYLPPLVTDLFSESPRPFSQTLDHYPLAQAAAAEIRYSLQNSQSLEKCIKENFKYSSDPYRKRKFLEIPLYLQDLLFEISKYYTTFPDNYDVLISTCLTLDDVIFVTLNYDIILDKRLSFYDGINNMDSYFKASQRWSLIKLHGSVNWGYEVLNNLAGIPISGKEDMLKAFRDLKDTLQTSHDIVFREGDTERIRSDGNKLFYPALSVPVGSEDELVCPPLHISYLKKKLADVGSLALLFIGYSGYDKEVISLLEESGKRVSNILAVNGSERSGRKLIASVAAKLHFTPQPNMVYKGTFNDFVRKGKLSDLINQLKKIETS